jgi:hypothetical protein
MTMQTTEFNARELCSRKLWQLVSTPGKGIIGETERQQAVAELAARRHYLAELARIGRVKAGTRGA